MTGIRWPLERSTPPLLLWRHTLDAGAGLALRALTLDEAFRPGTRSWTEVAFGRGGDVTGHADLPWDPRSAVRIVGTNVHVRGSIDRLDLNAAGDAARVSDYKTGAEPKNADRIVLGGGAELQRAIYALAASQLLPDMTRVVARLVFLGEDSPRAYRLPDVAAAIGEMATHVAAACALLDRGTALPGLDAREKWNEFRLALPAAATTYFQVKQSAFGRAFGGFSGVWASR